MFRHASQFGADSHSTKLESGLVSSLLCAPSDISNGEKKCLFKRAPTGARPPRT